MLKKIQVNLRKVSLFILTLALVLTLSIPAYSQKVVNLLQGEIFDVDTGLPIYTTIMFYSLTGKKNSARSEAANGSYQVVLNPGETYVVSFKGYLLLNESNTIFIPPSAEYKELKKNFKVKKIEKGLQVAAFKAFEPQQDEIIPSAKDEFEKLRSFLIANPDVNIRITVSSYDSYFNNSRKKVDYTDKKGKVRTKSVTYSSKEQLSDLLDQRAAALKEYMKAIQFPTAHTKFAQDLKVVPDSKKKIKRKKASGKGYEYIMPDAIPNIRISVERVLDL